jgi:hypothetical protein
MMKRLSILSIPLILVACSESLRFPKLEIDSIDNLYLSCRSSELDGFRDYYDVIMNKPKVNITLRWYFKDKHYEDQPICGPEPSACVYPKVITRKYFDYDGFYRWPADFIYEINKTSLILSEWSNEQRTKYSQPRKTWQCSLLHNYSEFQENEKSIINILRAEIEADAAESVERDKVRLQEATERKRLEKIRKSKEKI